MVGAMESLRITQDELKGLLHYNPDTGVFTWVKPISKRIKVGSIAGSESHGLTIIVINKKRYRAHRLAWLYMTGEWPTVDIKFVNGRQDDIRWKNLKKGTRVR
jgi:hypothetical protein